MSRQILKTIQQTDVKKKKTIGEIFVELNHKFPKGKLAKKLGISARTLRGYKSFLFGQTSRSIPEKRIEQLKKLAVKNGIKTYKRTEIKGIRGVTDLQDSLYTATQRSIDKAIKEHPDFSGFLVKINIIYKFKNGESVDKWYGDIYPASDRKNLNKIIVLFIKKLTAQKYVEYYTVKNIVISLNGEKEKRKTPNAGKAKTVKGRKSTKK